MIRRSTVIIMLLLAIISGCTGNYVIGQENGAVTFTCDKLEPAKRPLSEIPYRDAIHKAMGTFESCSVRDSLLVNPDPKVLMIPQYHFSNTKKELSYHFFMRTLYVAYMKHYSISLSPDMIWLLISHGFVNHINTNPEKYRRLLVGREGKRILKVKRLDFTKGKFDNPWHEVFEEFGRKIEKEVGSEYYNLMVPVFSTTGITEKAAFNVALMDSVKNYFIYEVYGECGFPSITIEGSPQDWRMILERLHKLEKYDCAWWTGKLIPIIHEFINASEKNINIKFWRELYKVRRFYGSEVVSGWIIQFFPYICNDKGTLVINRYIEKPPSKQFDGLAHSDFPAGLSKVSFTYINLLQPIGSGKFRRYDMELLAGYTGISQVKDKKLLRPEIGWIVRDK